MDESADGVAFVERLEDEYEDDPVDSDGPRLTEAGEAAKRQILSRLAALGISSCKLDYEGEQGKSRLYHCEGKGRDAACVPVPGDVSRMVNDFVRRVLPRCWDEELGSYGKVTFSVDSGLVVFDNQIPEVVYYPERFEV